MAWAGPPVAFAAHRPSVFPWTLPSDSGGEDKGAFAVGGDVFVVTAGATLLIGDAVYLSAAFTVNKSAVAGNQVARIGIIAGGVPRSVEASTLEVFQRPGDIGVTAAVLNDPVLLCVAGLCVGVADGAIAAGAQVKLSTATAGQVTTATPNTDSGKVLGTAWDAAGGVGDKIRILVAIA